MGMDSGMPKYYSVSVKLGFVVLLLQVLDRFAEWKDQEPLI